MHYSTTKIIPIVYTWLSPDRIHRNQFDYILDKRFGKFNYNNEDLSETNCRIHKQLMRNFQASYDRE